MTDTETQLRAEVDGLTTTIDVLRESLADVAAIIARDEAGWDQLHSLLDDERGFDAKTRSSMRRQAVAGLVAHPIIKRGVNLRIGYILGAGVSVSVRDDVGQGQDVNGVVQAFLDDHANQQTWTTPEAKYEAERQFALSGELALCLPTDPMSGRVRVRVIPAAEITDIISDPEDAAAEWLYLRQWTTRDGQQHRALYPSLAYRPANRPKTSSSQGVAVDLIQQAIKQAGVSLQETVIEWDQPILFVRVNKVGQRGVGDVFAALPWARAYKGFLESWNQYTRSLARISHQVRTRGDKVAETSARLAMAAQGPAGQGIVTDPNTYIDQVGRQGVTIDSDSGRPLAAMAAAALDIPVTTLLGDPGVTGARAVASDVTESSWALFDMRRALWESIIRQVCSYVIDAAVIAPAGKLHGTVLRDGDWQTAVLPEGDGRDVIVEFPARDITSDLDRLRAIQIADQLDKLPPLVIARAALTALGVDDVDEVLTQITDDHGQFIPPDVIDAQVRQRASDTGGASANG